MIDLLGNFHTQRSSLVLYEQKCPAGCLGVHAGHSTFLQCVGMVLCSDLGRSAPLANSCREGLVGNSFSTAATRSCIVSCRWLPIHSTLAEDKFSTGKSLDVATAVKS